MTPGQVWKMELGNATHDKLIQLAKSSGIQINEEVSGAYDDPDLNHSIHYRVDGIFFDEEDGQKKGMEAKSTYGRGIKEIYDNMKPREHDLKQIVAYAYLTGIHEWYLVYIGRDNGYRTQFKVEYRPDRDNIMVSHEYAHREFQIGWQDIKDKMVALERALKDRQLPIREYYQAIVKGEYKDKFQRQGVVYQSDWQCSYCAYRDTCWEPIRERTVDHNADMWEEHE